MDISIFDCPLLTYIFRIGFYSLGSLRSRSAEIGNMSRARGILPVAVATAIRIATGIAIFEPAFREEKEQKEVEGYLTFSFPLY